MPELQPSWSWPILTSRPRNWLKNRASVGRGWQSWQQYPASHPTSLPPLSKVANRHRLMHAHFFRLNSRLTGKASVRCLDSNQPEITTAVGILGTRDWARSCAPTFWFWRSLARSPRFWAARSAQYCGVPGACPAKLQIVRDTQDCLVLSRILETLSVSTTIAILQIFYDQNCEGCEPSKSGRRSRDKFAFDWAQDRTIHKISRGRRSKFALRP